MNLKIKNLSKTYPNGVQALKDINLDIPVGMFGLLGPNGAGKSTLMRTIATLQSADVGELFVNGSSIVRQKDEIRRMLGYLLQEFGVYHELTATQMLDQIALYKGIVNKKERRDSVETFLELTNLSQYKKQKLGSYSGGMKQRFGIAQALLGNPRLIIVDEPTAGLDPEERNRFYNILSDLSENIIVILSTHIVDDVRQLCSRLAIINNGEILITGQTSEIIDQLQKHVWQKVISKNEISNYDNKYEIILSRLYSGNILIHVMSNQNPGNGFIEVQPDLEDVYFATIKSLINPINKGISHV